MTSYSVGGFVGRSGMIPMVGLVISIPDVLVNTARGISLYNKISRIALEFTLQFHHLRTMPGHFKQTNRGKYDHRERTDVWKRKKRTIYRSITDLVASGRTRDFMLASFPKVAFSGKATEVLTGILKYRWPFPVSRDTSDPKHVTIQQMGNELRAWTHPESMHAVELYRDRWVMEWEKAVASRPKFRKAIEPILSGI